MERLASEGALFLPDSLETLSFHDVYMFLFSRAEILPRKDQHRIVARLGAMLPNLRCITLGSKPISVKVLDILSAHPDTFAFRVGWSRREYNMGWGIFEIMEGGIDGKVLMVEKPVKGLAKQNGCSGWGCCRTADAP